MTRGIYTTATGMTTLQDALDVAANNLANANTTGFKSDHVSFETMLEKQVSLNGRGGSTPIGQLSGGSEIKSSSIDFTEGPVEKTGNPTDVALLTPGFFKVQTPQGVRYTRDGSFKLDADGTLTNRSGYPILDDRDTPIKTTPGKLNISEDGTVSINDKKIAMLGIVSGDNLVKTGDNLFEGAVTPVKDPKMEGGSLEGANLSVIKVMVNMIEIMRAYESNQKALSTQDDALSKSVNEIAKV